MSHLDDALVDPDVKKYNYKTALDKVCYHVDAKQFDEVGWSETMFTTCVKMNYLFQKFPSISLSVKHLLGKNLHLDFSWLI